MEIIEMPASCLLNKAFIDRVKTPIIHVWNIIGADALDCEDDMSNETAVEFCIDANRLDSIANDGEADQMIVDQCRIHGYTKVLRYLAKNISLY